MFQINNISRGLKLKADGIWYSKAQKEISYPKNGNKLCYDIEDTSFWFQHRNNCIIALVNQYPPINNQPIFDIGGGNGYVAYGLIQSGFNTVLVEPGNTGALNAKARGIKHVICSTVEHAGFFPNSLSAVGLFDTIEHINDDKLFLKSIHSLMQKNGRLYITVPSYPFLWSSEDVMAGHFRRYSMKNICKTIESAGFVVDFSSYIFRFLPIPIFLFRSLPSKLKIKENESSKRKISRDHCMDGFISAKLLGVLLQREIRHLTDRQPMLYGGSCIIAAKRI